MKTRAPNQPTPALSCDCHFHIFGPLGWPHPQMDPAPEAGLLLEQFFEWGPDVAIRQKVLVRNAARFYGF